MPDGAWCLTARTAKRRVMPNCATGAQGHSGATAQRRNGATAQRNVLLESGVLSVFGGQWRTAAEESPTSQCFVCGRITARPHRSRMAYRDLDVLDAAERAADMLDDLIERHPGQQLLHVSQMRRCIQSIAANIAEGFARGKGRDRNRSLEIARGETEEAIRHLNANYRTNRIEPSEYWPFRNLLVVIAKMLTSLLNR